MTNNINNSVLRYNGCDIPYIKTELFTQEPVWSADGTDLIYTHIVIGVSGILNACFLNGMDPAEWIERARPIMLQRGKQLYFFIGGVQVVPPPFGTGAIKAEPTTGKELVASPIYMNPAATACASSSSQLVDKPLDAKLGPKPKKLDIRAIRGGTYSIYYEIETWVPYCETPGQPATILSNRWDSSVDIDKDYYYTRTTNGTLVLNGQYLTATPAPSTLNANATLILPPLFKNWKREVVRFTLSSDQLTLTYSIQDKQRYTATPFPAINIDASYAEIVPASQHPTPGNAPALMNLMQINMDVTVTGDPNAQVADSYPTLSGGGTYNPDKLKYELMKIMFELVFSRIQFPFITSGNNFANNEYITHFEMREDVMRPVVGCRVVAFKTRTLAANKIGAPAEWKSNVFALTNVGSPILVDEIIAQVSTQPIAIGSWATYLLFCSIAPQDPCAGGNIPAVYGYYAPTKSETFGGKTVSGQTTAETGYKTTVGLAYSPANYNYPFTEYTATVDYVTDNHIIQLPIMYDVEQGTTNGTTQASSLFCQTASPTSKKIIHWKSSRLGAWPKAPRPDSVDIYDGGKPSDRMLNYIFQAGEVELTNDGLTRQYSIAGVYEIGMARRVQWDVVSTVLSTICNPVIGSSVYGDLDASYPTNNFIHGILCSGTSPGAA